MGNSKANAEHRVQVICLYRAMLYYSYKQGFVALRCKLQARHRELGGFDRDFPAYL